jgi:hypothetical protein
LAARGPKRTRGGGIGRAAWVVGLIGFGLASRQLAPFRA